MAQKRDEFEKDFLARQHQFQEELLNRERDREIEKSKFKAEVNAKYEKKLESLRETHASMQQQFAEYEIALCARYEKVLG